MDLIIDDDVKAVAEFMQGRMAASKLVSVASAIAALAPILWGHFGPEDVAALRLRSLSLNVVHAAHTQPIATAPASTADAGDDFAAAAS